MQQNILSQMPASGSQQDVASARQSKSSRDPETGKSRFDEVSRAQEKRLEQQRLNLQIEDRRSQLNVSLQSLLHSLSLIEKEKQTATAVSKLSADQLRNEIERFKLGKSTSYRISQFQQDVVEAQQAEILVRIRQEKIQVELLALTGEFFEKYELNQE